MNARCPVCCRPVEATATTGRVWRHNDKAGNWCPMTGNHLPLEQHEEVA
jgi:hypothetical protein